jgi:hypothetical protein
MNEILRRLTELKSLMKSGQFNDDLKVKAEAMRQMIDYHRNEFMRDEVNYLKSHCLIAEVYDYFGKTTEAVAVLEKEEKNVLKQLDHVSGQLKNKSLSLRSGDRKLIRERIRFCLVHSQVNLYRKNYYEPFIEKVRLCQNITSAIKDNKQFPCWGTRASIAYQLARAYRQINDFDSGEKYFAESMDFYYQRAEQKKAAYDKREIDYTAYEDDLSFSRYRSAIALGLGLGWVNFTKGLLVSALRNNILPARIMLAHTQDKVNKAYLDIIFGAIKRCLADDDIDELEAAIKIIRASHTAFKDNQRYLARAAYELSLAHLYLSYLFKKREDRSKCAHQMNQARSSIQQVLDISQSLGDGRWMSNAYVVKSRIERWDDKYREAENLATEALNIADQYGQLLCQIDARLARGKARIKRGDLDGAQKDFEEANKLNKFSSSPNFPKLPEPRNPRVQAVCYLNLARICVRNREEQPAKNYWTDAKALLKDVQHVIIHKFADQVESEIEEMNPDFIIKVKDVFKGGKGYNEYHEELIKFLMEQASMRTPTDVKAAKLINKPRATFLSWKKKYFG